MKIHLTETFTDISVIFESTSFFYAFQMSNTDSANVIQLLLQKDGVMQYIRIDEQTNKTQRVNLPI